MKKRRIRYKTSNRHIIEMAVVYLAMALIITVVVMNAGCTTTPEASYDAFIEEGDTSAVEALDDNTHRFMHDLYFHVHAFDLGGGE